MKMRMGYLLAVASAFVVPSVYASCDRGMDAETMVECISVENAGENYQAWRAQYEMIGTGMSREEDGSIGTMVSQMDAADE